jgi:hypothetical protein
VGLGHAWLWTSEFNETSWQPSAGAVARTTYGSAGRLYLNYIFPTGCVWATKSNPCMIQSKRLQGPEITQEFQVLPHLRWGIEAGAFHFCDQSNENDRSIPRTCHWAFTEMVDFRFEFRGHSPDEIY